MPQSDLPKADREVKGEEDTDKETQTAESSPYNSHRANGGEPEETVPPSGNFHPKILEALSEAPYSPLFGILWPIIIKQASFETRDVLRKVNTYFERLCRASRRSDRAKRNYVSYLEKREGFPFVLDLSFGIEWRCWFADMCDFSSFETFCSFCALGGVDPDQKRKCPSGSYIWMSRTKDIVFETLRDPSPGGACQYLGLTGVADKAIAMYNFVHDNYDGLGDESAMATSWTVMGWDWDYRDMTLCIPC